MTWQFQLVDVFAAAPFQGNPLAVVQGAADLSSAEMLQIARWLNLSETTFLLPPRTPAADYRVRIFTLTGEIPFAGHPTIGSCHAWLTWGGTPQRPDEVVQECGVGLVTLHRTGDQFAFAAPPLLRGGSVTEAEISAIATFLQIERGAIVDAQWGDNGPGWVIALLESAEAVLALEPQRSAAQPIAIGVVGAHPAAHTADWEVRAFFSDPYGSIIEDPVTGSLNASVAQWLLSSGRAHAPYRACQGTRIGRNGQITITQDQRGQVWVGGQALTIFTGSRDAC